MSREAMKLALDCLIAAYNMQQIDDLIPPHAPVKQAITALRQALEQPADEPVAWDGYDLDAMVEAFERVIEAHFNRKNPFHNPIDADAQMALRVLRGFIPYMKSYTRPQPAAQWVGLTDEEIEQKSSKKCSCFAYSASECICGAWDQQPIAHRFVDVECPLCGEMAVAHTHPNLKKREWVGLTDEEIALVCGECAASAHNWNDISFARAIEQALKEKNT